MAASAVASPAARATALLRRLARVGGTIARAEVCGGVLACAVVAGFAALHDSSAGTWWPGFGAVALCAGAAFVLDDPAAGAADATPTSLARRRLLRIALALPLLCVAWVVSLWFATPGDGTPFGPGARGGLTLQFAALVALTLACSAIALRVMSDGRAGWLGAVAPFALLGVAWWLPERWTLLAAPGDAAWPASQLRWLALLVLALVALALASRDPAARRVRWRSRCREV